MEGKLSLSRITLPVMALLAVTSHAWAQTLDAPPALTEPPRVVIKGEEPTTEPPASELLAPKQVVHGETRIDQRRQGTRVREIVVTPAGQSYSYTIENREGRRPLSPQELASGLSTPRFLKLEF